MPNEILPINNLSEIGLIMDTPSVSLPPNAFSDCQNVRFRDGAIRKFPGETPITFNPPLPDPIEIEYVALWRSTGELLGGLKYVIVYSASATLSNIVVYNIAGQQ